ncbi:helix-turn-helix domain-containing protein [Candidatus Dojkabacteria bacterium]|nr:helix-turn-helix domain-containing protein [Candidatus Dojkabacteria bacterium]
MASIMVDTEDIHQNLIRLGLDENEAEVYMTLLGAPSMTILELSRSTNIPRSTVYRIAESLAKKKFAEWIIEHNSKKVRAITPEYLGFVVKEKKTELEEAEVSLNNLQDMIGNIVTKVPKTQVRYYQGKEGIRQIIWNTLKAKKGVFGYSEFGRIEVVGRNFYNDYVQEFRARGLTDRVIANENCFGYLDKHVLTELEKHQLESTGIRIIPKKIFYCTGDHSLYNNIYSISYWRKNETIGVEIENEELVKMHASIFEMMWKIAEPVADFFKKSKNKKVKSKKKRG